MITKLTLASQKDKKPTLNANKLQCKFNKVIIEILLDGKIFKSSWHLSRNGKTYYADIWNEKLPSVGNPIECKIISIESKL